MPRCTFEEMTEDEKPQPPTENKNSAPTPTTANPFQLPKPEEMKEYRKPKIVEAAPSKRKEKMEKELEKTAPLDNPDVNRVESARRAVREFEDLFKKIQIDYPQSLPLNIYIVKRALMYYLMRFGESLHSTSEKWRLSESAHG